MKRALLAATAILISSFNPVLITPAFAAKPPLVPPATDGMSMQDVCDAQLTPNDPADFQTFPKPGTIVEVTTPGTPEKDGDAFLVEPGGTPTYSDFSNWGLPFRNGGSPNIWAAAEFGAATYPFTVLHFHTTVTDSIASTFACEVLKTNPNNIADPAGLETTGNIVVDTDTHSGPDVTEQGDPITIPGTFVAQVLICISPNNVTKGKPGTWTGKHTFTDQECYDLDKSDLSTWVPSHNAPDVYP